MSYPRLDVRERHDLAPQHPALHAPPAHVSFVDRLSLRVGLWLLLRSAQSVQHRASHAQQAERLRHARAREAREHGFERAWLQGPTL